MSTPRQRASSMIAICVLIAALLGLSGTQAQADEC